MTKKKINDVAKWVIVALALLTLAFNSGVLYNDVKHLKEALAEVKQEVKSINMYLLQKSKDGRI